MSIPSAYTLATTIEGPVDCTVAQIVASVLDCPQRDGWLERTRYSDAELVVYAEAWIYWTGLFGFRTAGQVGRANHETNHLRYTGDVPHGTGNFAGLGATGGVPGESYVVLRGDGTVDVAATIWAGVGAVCAHQGAYTWSAVERWPEHLRQYHNASRRYRNVLGSGHAGTVTTWGDFTNGRWAWTRALPVGTLDNGYARSSVAKANHVLEQDGGEPMAGDMPGVPFIAADSRHYTKGRSDPWPTQIIGHHTNGHDSLAWLTTSVNSNVSASVLLWHDGTIRAQLVRFADTPHTTGYMNDDSLSFEWERFWETQKAISGTQYANIARSVATMYQAERARGNPHFAGPMARTHLADHNDFYDTVCPGNLDLGRVFLLAAALVDPAAPPVEDVIELNGYRIVLGFKGFWRELAVYEPTLPYRVLGLPLANEVSPRDGIAYQEFERGWLKWNRDEPPPWHIHVAFKDDHP